MAGIEFEALGDWARKQEEAEAEKAAAVRVHEDHPCEVCDRPASFGFGPGGWHGLRKPRAWFCGKHKRFGEELLK
ncbi:hypothetical protein [Methylobacterium platani]|uniref:Uncharacterized protein n=2 Tax=Methylobacterium platani TaxID=427683 RepID=A0A179SFU4_9HYPH|nr:hypothetical protein [Methylobacterium platani]KMO21408.1 hypothetical protein SQ03_03400 [Methylobacterium platani JCM 14648]OAS26312.1 hypothetical protein A5481_06250 [Methylobacterium platani]